MGCCARVKFRLFAEESCVALRPARDVDPGSCRAGEAGRTAGIGKGNDEMRGVDEMDVSWRCYTRGSVYVCVRVGGRACVCVCGRVGGSACVGG